MEKLIRPTSVNHMIHDLERRSLPIRERIRARYVKASLDSKENAWIHGTRQMEQQLLSYIREGNEEGIRLFFDHLSHLESISTGVLADTPLRQEKNVFIGFVGLVGKTAAIEGGMDEEAAYRLVDIYSQECEDAQTTEEIDVLRYLMVLDFTQRVHLVKSPDAISPDVRKAMHYINENVFLPLTIDEIADHLKISRSSLTRKFRKELHKSIGEYTNEIRIREAQRLLLYSDMSISEIAGYLSYCNQPHFQMVFKKHTDMTPMEYRKKTR